VRLGNPWHLKGYQQKLGESLGYYILHFSRKCHELPSVADVDIISTFWDDMICRTLVQELGHEQPTTTKELLGIAIRHTSGEEAVGTAFVLGNAKAATNSGRAAPSVATTKGARKGGNKGLKWCPCHIAVAASNNGGNEEAGNSDEECVAAAECDFKHQTWPPKDHFKKLLKATCPHHSYPIKHKLKDCTMIKNFMMSMALSKGRKPREGPGGKGHGTPQLAAVRGPG
jgi:hypothetical protein